AGGADGDHDLLVVLGGQAVEGAGFFEDRRAELLDAVVGRVDGAVALDGRDGPGLDGAGRGEVADTLPEVDPADAVDGEGDGADVGLAEGVGALGEGLHGRDEGRGRTGEAQYRFSGARSMGERGEDGRGMSPPWRMSPPLEEGGPRPLPRLALGPRTFLRPS